MATASSPNGTWQVLRSRFDRLGRRFGAWTLGFGLVGLHVALFLVAATALTLLDLYRSPDQLTVDDGLRTWGSIVALHALAITVFQIVRWAIHEEQIEPVAPVLDRSPSTPLSTQTDVATAAVSNGHAGGAWWRDLRGSWRTLMDANDSASVATAAVPTPTANGHTPNGNHVWPRRDTATVQPGAWPDLPLDPPLSADSYGASNGANHTDAVSVQWSWVEAAAASWLTPSEPEPPAAPPPPSPDDPDSPAPTA